jgi:hypothetical protein
MRRPNGGHGDGGGGNTQIGPHLDANGVARASLRWRKARRSWSLEQSAVGALVRPDRRLQGAAAAMAAWPLRREGGAREWQRAEGEGGLLLWFMASTRSGGATQGCVASGVVRRRPRGGRRLPVSGARARSSAGGGSGVRRWWERAGPTSALGRDRRRSAQQEKKEIFLFIFFNNSSKTLILSKQKAFSQIGPKTKLLRKIFSTTLL